MAYFKLAVLLRLMAKEVVLMVSGVAVTVSPVRAVLLSTGLVSSVREKKV
jgi:hypothetical protein